MVIKEEEINKDIFNISARSSDGLVEAIEGKKQ
jgi:gamma-glutamyl-gamma-aminobutyrate hydrolase PuuD